MAKRPDPSFLLAVLAGTAAVIGFRMAQSKPVSRAELVGYTTSALGVGMTLPAVFTHFYPSATNFLHFVGFACAVGGVPVYKLLVKMIPQLLERKFTESRPEDSPEE